MKPTFRIGLAVVLVATLVLCVTGAGSVAAQSDRVVEDGEKVFLGEDNIDTGSGVFENLNPSDFSDGDGNTLSITDGFVEPDNEARRHTATDPQTGEEASVLVREARIQRVRPINARSGARLDFPGTPRVPPGENNLQVAVDYNYYESTELDEELSQDGSDVTNIYLDESQDRANTGSETTAADGTRYDAVFTFSITDSGEYNFVVEPLTGDDRPDGRDIGFDDRGEVADSYTVNVASSERRDEDGDGEVDEDEEDVGNGDERDRDGNVTEGEDGTDGEMNGDGETDGDGDMSDGGDVDGEGETEDGGEATDGGEANGDDGVDEDGNATDGEDGTEGVEPNGDDGEGEDGQEEGSEGEGMSGFTVLAALVALATATVVAATRRI